MMQHRFKKWLLLLPLLLTVVLLALVWLADYWLESSGGRSRLESALADALGMPVRLQGDFNVSLLPDIGVAGSHLEIGDPAEGALLLRCDAYHVAISLWSLLHGQLVVLAVRAEDGVLDPTRINSDSPPTSMEPDKEFFLPQIDFLQLDEFRVLLGDEGDSSIQLHHFELEGLQLATAIPLEMEFSLMSNSDTIMAVKSRSTLNLGHGLRRADLNLDSVELQAAGSSFETISGTVSWDQKLNQLETQLAGDEPGIGEVAVSATFLLESKTGSLALEFNPEGRDELATADLAFRSSENGFDLSDLLMVVADQKLEGDGCIRTLGETTLHLELKSEVIDLDRLLAWLPGDAAAGGDEPSLPFDLRFELSADQVQSAGVIAHQVKLGSGDPPDCLFFQE